MANNNIVCIPGIAMNGLSHASGLGVAFNTFSAADDFFNAHGQYKQTTSPPNVPYSGYNLRGAISANHQISHLEVTFAITKFANHGMVLRGRINLRGQRLSIFRL